MTAFRRAKSLIRDGMPASWRVPMKFWHASLARTIEPEMALLPMLVTRGGHAVDVGGNFGLYAHVLARLGVRVDVFEPNPRCLVALNAWAERRESVRVHPYALSAAPGRAELAIPIEGNGVEHDAAASLERREGAAIRAETVELRTLDNFGFTDIQLIKIDVEGHEEQVLAGAQVTIAASRPALLVEIEQRHRSQPITEMFGRMMSMGYTGFFLLDGELVGLERFDVAEHQSVAAFTTRAAVYHNNFLFLADERIAVGDYREIGR